MDMQRRTTALSGLSVFVLLGLSSQASAQVQWHYASGGTTYTLQGCTRLPSLTLQCQFVVENKQRDIRYGHRPDSVILTSPQGRQVRLYSYEFGGQYHAASSQENIALQAGKQYDLKLNFINYPENEIKSLSIAGAGQQHNILVGKAVSSGAVSAVAGRPAQAPVSRRTKDLPQNQLTRKVEVGDGLYTAIVHGCTLENDRPQKDSASCLVSLVGERAEGSVMNDATVYPALLMQLSRQPVSQGVVNLRVGNQVFEGVPVLSPSAPTNSPKP